MPLDPLFAPKPPKGGLLPSPEGDGMGEGV